jgi:hypothetical protein
MQAGSPRKPLVTRKSVQEVYWQRWGVLRFNVCERRAGSELDRGSRWVARL